MAQKDCYESACVYGRTPIWHDDFFREKLRASQKRTKQLLCKRNWGTSLLLSMLMWSCSSPIPPQNTDASHWVGAWNYPFLALPPALCVAHLHCGLLMPPCADTAHEGCGMGEGLEHPRLPAHCPHSSGLHWGCSHRVSCRKRRYQFFSFLSPSFFFFLVFIFNMLLQQLEAGNLGKIERSVHSRVIILPRALRNAPLQPNFSSSYSHKQSHWSQLKQQTQLCRANSAWKLGHTFMAVYKLVVTSCNNGFQMLEEEFTVQ